MARLTAFLVFCLVFVSLAVFGAAIPFRWCATGSKEMAKCNAFKAALPAIATSAGVDITPGCVSGSNDKDCMKKIKDGDADLITLDGGKIVIAGDEYDLQPVVAEDYGGGDGASYYAVAVAKASNKAVTLNTLKGKKSCHTGYQKTSGWNIPIGHLLRENKLPREGCGKYQDAISVEDFFSGSCVPGAPPGHSKLCALCKAPVDKKCSTVSGINKFAGYHGAFYCMANGTGDVAFVKHLTAGEVVAEGYYGNLSDYVYLCTNGGREVVTPTSHANCNLGKSPSHAVMAKNTGNIATYKKVLLEASRLCQVNTTAQNCSNFLIFNSKKFQSGNDLLFKDSTKRLIDVGNKNTYKLWLGIYYSDVQALKSTKLTCSSTAIQGSLSVLVGLLFTVVMSFGV